MKIIRKATILIFGIFLIQICTFFTIANQKLIKHIGLNYETHLPGIGRNEIEEISFVSELMPTEKQIHKHFRKLENIKIRICKSLEECPEIRKSESFYYYWVNFRIRNPIGVNKVDESEFAKYYGASWESDYVWIIFKWILIEKRSTGIS